MVTVLGTKIGMENGAGGDKKDGRRWSPDNPRLSQSAEFRNTTKRRYSHLCSKKNLYIKDSSVLQKMENLLISFFFLQLYHSLEGNTKIYQHHYLESYMELYQVFNCSSERAQCDVYVCVCVSRSLNLSFKGSPFRGKIKDCNIAIF